MIVTSVKNIIISLKKYKYLVFPGIAVSVAFIFIYFFLFGLKVKRLIIISESKDIKGLNVFSRKNILLSETEKIIPEILAQNTFLKDIKMKKNFPSEIIIYPVWRTPAARIISEGSPFFVDSEGFPSKSENTMNNLPEIYMTKLVYNKNSPDWKVVKSVNYINTLKKYNLNLSEITIKDGPLEMYGIIDDSIEFFTSLNSDPITTSASLQTIISRFRIEGKFISKIDFRFDKPVVTLKNE